jgi:uncharacterized protein (DUF58 family)
MTSPSSALPAELKRIQLRSRRLVTGDLLGQYRSAFRGSGLIYSDLREYQPGDDVKHIHWKATARTGTAFVKSYEEDRQLRVVLAVDVSASMRASIGYEAQAKALEFCSLIGALTQRGNDLLGLLLFADEPISYLPPKAGAKRFSRIMSAILSEPSRAAGTSLNKALNHLSLSVRKSSIIFVVSDFVGGDCKQELAKLSARHDVILVHLQQPVASIPNGGLLTFRDAESGELVTVDTSSSTVQRAWAKRLDEDRSTLRRLADETGAAHIVVHEHAATPLIHLMKERVKRVTR